MQAPTLTQEYAYDSRGSLINYRLNDSEEKYTYDPLQQLTCESEHTYSYDSVGNRLTKNNLTHTLNDLSQVTSDGQKEYTYDINGNLISIDETLFSYDSLDRLIEVNKAGKKYFYTYDPFNRRLSKVTPSEKVYYYWDDKNEIGSTKGELRILGEGFGAEIGAAVFIKLGKSIYTTIHDHRGALLALLDKNGKAQESLRYTAYGEELTKSNLSPWRFASKRVDEETGYVYFGRRYYCPDLGRWITTDPNGFQDGPNLYAYVHNSPLTGIDFYGEYAYWHQTKEWTKNAINFAFPCASELFKLPADASLLKRG